jgi:hypothetical protein
MIDLKNTQKRTVTFNLAHSALRDAPAPFGYVTINGGSMVHDPKTGTVGAKKTKKRSPTSITFLPEEEKKGLPNIIKECPEVRAAIAGKTLRVLRENSEQPKP